MAPGPNSGSAAEALAPRERARRTCLRADAHSFVMECAMPYLKIGDWSIHANGIRGTLWIGEIDELGPVSGTLFDEPVTGEAGADRTAFRRHEPNERARIAVANRAAVLVAGWVDASGGVAGTRSVVAAARALDSKVGASNSRAAASRLLNLSVTV
jgi:hypothetical protein